MATTPKKNDDSPSPFLQKPLTGKIPPYSTNNPTPTPIQATLVKLGGSFFKKRTKGHKIRAGLCWENDSIQRERDGDRRVTG